MATDIGIGFSQHPDPLQAFKEAAIAVKHQTNLATADLAFVFSTPGYMPDPAAMNAIKKVIQPEHLIYALTPGLILPQSIEMRGVSIISIRSDEIKFRPCLKDQLSLFQLQESGIRFARETSTFLEASKRHAFCYFLSGTQKNNSPLIKGLQEGLGRAFPIFGAVSSGGQKNESSLIGYQEQTFTDAAIGLLIGGQLTLGFGTHHGWQPLGRPRIITDAEGNLIRKIDGQPAIKLYENYFKEELTKLEAGKLDTIGLLYPLGIGTETRKKFLIRHPVEVLPDGSIVTQGEVTPGAQVHLMIADKDSCRQAAQTAAHEARERLQGKQPKMIFVLESMARRKLLGRGAWQEIATIKQILGLTAPIFGMYTYGEIAPQGGAHDLHNVQIQSASIVIIAIG